MLMVLAIGICNLAVAQQTTGDVLGTITDPSGAVVVGAKVTVENTGTHEIRTAQSNDAGDYVFNLLNPGDYRVTAAGTGFKKFTLESLHLAAGDRIRVNVQFVPGSTTETVLVNSQPPALQTDTSVMQSTIGEQTTQDMPLNGRNFVQLIQLIPGANEGPPNSLSSGTQFDDRRQSASVSVNGQSEALNNEMIDGADNIERLIDTTAVRPSIEAIAEMSIQTNTYTAEAGRTGGAIVNVITKSGTNQFHGSLFEFFRNDLLDASAYQFGGNFAKSEERLNQFGGSLGGPIVKNKTFFFGAYEGYRQVVGTSPILSIVPTAYEEQHPGDFSDVGGQVLTSMDPVALKYFKMYPTPNDGSNKYLGISKKPQFSTDYDARVDHSFNANNQLYGRFIYGNVNSDFSGESSNFPDVTVDGMTMNPSLYGSNAHDLDFDVLVNYIHTFNNNLLLELKAAYTHSNNQTYPNTLGLNPNAAFGQPNVNTPIDDSTGLASIFVNSGAGLGQMIFQPLADKDNSYQYLGAVTWTHGKHNVKIGATVIRRQLTSFQSNYPEGAWDFADYPSLLQGQYLSNGGRSLSLDDPHLRIWEPSVYVQDDWHASRSLTLNLGIRYDHFTPFSEIENRISTFDPSDGALLVAGQNGVSKTAGVHPDYHGVEPRVGFAYTLGHGMVVRGGYGIGYVPMNTTAYANLKNIPFVASTTACGYSNCGSGYETFADGLPPIVAGKITDPGAAITAATDPHFRTSYYQQYNLTLQKEFSGNVLTISYIGLLGRQLREYISDLNAPPPNACGSDATCYNALRPYYGPDPNLGSVQIERSGGNSTYNSLQVSFERRLAHGLTANVNYQYASNIDDINGVSEQNSVGGYASVPSLVSTRDRGTSDLEIRNRIAGTIHYNMPFGAGSSGAKALAIKGWQVNVIGVESGGQPFTVTNATNIDNTHPGASGSDRPNVVGSVKLSNPGIGEFFNVNAFPYCAPPQTAGTCTQSGYQAMGTLGNEGRNMLVGPHYRHLDISFMKVFPIKDRLNAEFRAEGFNVTNTTNFATPNASLGGTNFGMITGVIPSYTPREIQFALKLKF
jgi:hypothetical protein